MSSTIRIKKEMKNNWFTMKQKKKLKNKKLKYNSKNEKLNEILFLFIHFFSFLFSTLILNLLSVRNSVEWKSQTVKVLLHSFHHVCRSLSACKNRGVWRLWILAGIFIVLFTSSYLYGRHTRKRSEGRKKKARERRRGYCAAFAKNVTYSRDFNATRCRVFSFTFASRALYRPRDETTGFLLLSASGMELKPR